MSGIRLFAGVTVSVTLFAVATSVAIAAPKKPLPPPRDNASCVGKGIILQPSKVSPGQTFRATEALRNTGTTTWGKGVTIFVQHTNQSVDSELGSSIRPKGWFGDSVILNAPENPGTYTVTAQMLRNGLPFGQICSQSYTVKAPTTQCSDKIDNDGDGNVDFPKDKGCKNAKDDNEGDGLMDTFIHAQWPDVVSPGQVLQYMIAAGNGGPDAASAELTTTIPTGLTLNTAATDPACTSVNGIISCGKVLVKPQEWSFKYSVAFDVPPTYSEKNISLTAAVNKLANDRNPKNNMLTLQTKVVPVAATIKVLSPNGGEIWMTGSTQTVRWSTNNTIPGSTILIQIYKGESVVFHNIVENDGDEALTVTDTMGTGNDFTMVLNILDPNGVNIEDGRSENPFSIVPKPTDCGNGIIEGSEACDDSNTTDGDGCSVTCTVEQTGTGFLLGNVVEYVRGQIGTVQGDPHYDEDFDMDSNGGINLGDALILRGLQTIPEDQFTAVMQKLFHAIKSRLSVSSSNPNYLSCLDFDGNGYIQAKDGLKFRGYIEQLR